MKEPHEITNEESYYKEGFFDTILVGLKVLFGE